MLAWLYSFSYLAPMRAKDKQINFRAYQEDYDNLRHASTATHLPVSHLIRACIKAYLCKLVKTHGGGK